MEHKNILPLIAFHFDDVALDCAWTVTEWHEYGNVLSYIEATNPDEEERLQLVTNCLLFFELLKLIFFFVLLTGEGHGVWAGLSTYPFATCLSWRY